MVNPSSTESILNQMTNLAMDIALDYVLPASPMSDVCKGDLYEFEREVVAAVNGSMSGGLLTSMVSGTAGIPGGCCGRPPVDLCKKNSYIGAAGCDTCEACTTRRALMSDPSNVHRNNTNSLSTWSAYQPQSLAQSPAFAPSATPASAMVSTQPKPQQTPETTMDISWCQFDGCEFDTADNSYLDICDWIFYADRYALTDENLEKVRQAFQMVPPGEVTGYVAAPPKPEPQQHQQVHTKSQTTTTFITNATASGGLTIKKEIKSEPNYDDDYLWTSDHHLQPIILKAEPDADILQITELDHTYIHTGINNSTNSSTVVSPTKHHPNHLVDMLGLVTPPPSRSQSSEEEEIDVVNDSWDTPDTPRKGATMADIMKRGIVKKRDPPVTKWKNTVKRKLKNTTTVAAAYPMQPPPPKRVCTGQSLMDRYKKKTPVVKFKEEPVDTIKLEPLDDEDDDYNNNKNHNRNNDVNNAYGVTNALFNAALVIKPEPSDHDDDIDNNMDDDDDDDDDDYDMDADFESLMKNEPEDMFDDDYDDYDDENDIDWNKMMRGTNATETSGGRRRRGKSSGASSCSSSSVCGSNGRTKKKKKKKKKTSLTKSSSKHHHHHHQQTSVAGKKIKYEPGTYNYKTKLMDPVKRALHNDLEKSRRVETSMLFMNLSMQVSFLDDNRKIPSKLSILRGAKRECDLMMLDERRLLSEKHVMQQKQRMLRERLFELRREQYHRRYGKTNNSKQQQQQQQQH